MHKADIGIKDIGSYIPENRISNYDRKDIFKITDNFIEDKLGVERIAVKRDDEETSDLCVKAFENLSRKIPIAPSDIEVLAVVTQNPDTIVPHTSSIVHGKLALKENCACFDIALGCAGFVYGLGIIQSFMKEHGFGTGLLFTADPYSKIVDATDKNTSLLFGDASSVTLISSSPVYVSRGITFGTLGSNYRELAYRDGKLQMHGRAVLDFVMRYVPDDIHTLLKKSRIDLRDIDKFVFHQGSRYIVDMLTKRLKLDKNKVVFDIYDYGNTVSSSIPIILEKVISDINNRNILISGFGTGLSWSSALLARV